MLDRLASLFETAPEVSVWYPPFALDVALLLLFGLHYWPALMLNTLIHVALVSPAVNFDFGSVLVFDTTTTAGYAGAAFILVRKLAIDPGLRRRRDVVNFVMVAVLGAPFFVAMSQVLNLTLTHTLPVRDALVNTLRFFAGNATGVAMLSPCLLVLARRYAATLAYRSVKPMVADEPGVISSSRPWLQRQHLIEAGVLLATV